MFSILCTGAQVRRRQEDEVIGVALERGCARSGASRRHIRRFCNVGDRDGSMFSSGPHGTLVARDSRALRKCLAPGHRREALGDFVPYVEAATTDVRSRRHTAFHASTSI